LDVEPRLGGGADLDLAGVRPHAECDSVVLFLLTHALLGHERADQDLAGRARHCSDLRGAGRLRGWPAPGATRLRPLPAPTSLLPGAGRPRGRPAVGTGCLVPPAAAPAPGSRRRPAPPVRAPWVD